MFGRPKLAERTEPLLIQQTAVPKPMQAQIAQGPIVMKRVIVESPFANEDTKIVQRNIRYARDACRDCVMKGENPFASHVFYTQFLDDRNPAERRAGIDMGFQHWQHADSIVFYLDLGLSPGMEKALLRAFSLGLHIERRFLDKAEQPEPIPADTDIETAMEQFVQSKTGAAEPDPDAKNSNARTDGPEDRQPERVGSGVDLQRA